MLANLLSGYPGVPGPGGVGFAAQDRSYMRFENVVGLGTWRHTGEPDISKGPVDLCAGERERHGWRALDFQAMQESITMKVPPANQARLRLIWRRRARACTNLVVAEKSRMDLFSPWTNRPVAQLAERRSPKPQVGGSIPSWPAIRSAPGNGTGERTAEQRRRGDRSSSRVRWLLKLPGEMLTRMRETHRSAYSIWV